MMRNLCYSKIKFEDELECFIGSNIRGDILWGTSLNKIKFEQAREIGLNFLIFMQILTICLCFLISVSLVASEVNVC